MALNIRTAMPTLCHRRCHTIRTTAIHLRSNRLNVTLHAAFGAKEGTMSDELRQYQHRQSLNTPPPELSARTVAALAQSVFATYLPMITKSWSNPNRWPDRSFDPHEFKPVARSLNPIARTQIAPRPTR
jgi:hypothetical protein